MEVKRLSEYITSLRLVLKEHGDIEVVSVVGQEYFPTDMPTVKLALEDETHPGAGDIMDHGKKKQTDEMLKKVCVVCDLW